MSAVAPPPRDEHVSWSGTHVSSEQVAERLRRLHREHALQERRHAATRTLNLLVAPGADVPAARVSASLSLLLPRHPARTIVMREHEHDRLDAELELNCGIADASDSGCCGQCHDSVTLVGDAPRLGHAGSLVRPLLVAGLPTVLWLPGGEPSPAEEPLAGVAESVVLDTAIAPNGLAAAFTRASRLGAAADVLDLAWMRLARWRQRLAAAFEDPPTQPLLAQTERLEVSFSGPDAAAPLLLAGWIAARAGWALTRMSGSGETWSGGALRADGGRVTLTLGGSAEPAGIHVLALHCDSGPVRLEEPVAEPDAEHAFTVALARADAGAGAPGYAAALTAIAQGLAAA